MAAIHVTCPRCSGTGWNGEEWDRSRACELCRGSGQASMLEPIDGHGGIVMRKTWQDACPRCGQWEGCRCSQVTRGDRDG